MKKLLLCLFVFMAIISYSCNDAAGYGEPVVGPASIQRSLVNWLYYSEANVTLSQDFTALDEAMNNIGKERFLKQLITGDYLPLKLHTKDAGVCYQLYKITSAADNDIRETIKNMAVLEYGHFEMEGRTFPAFSFTDIDGKIYNREITKGKILVLKCWFINCPACIQEMTALNKLVNQYKDRKDILFVSLASDPADSLRSFLSKTMLRYAVVANQDSYMLNRLNVTMFPTHFIVNKDGLIVKEVNSAAEVITTLNKEIAAK